jgi:hypothetical protein
MDRREIYLQKLRTNSKAYNYTGKDSVNDRKQDFWLNFAIGAMIFSGVAKILALFLK